MEYGVTVNGFVRKRLPEIREDIFKSLEQKLGSSVSRQPNSMIGVLVGVYAAELDRMWQLLERDYYDRSPISAGEGSLDNTLAYTNVQRKKAQASYLYAVCYGRSGMVLPANCQIKDTSGYKWDIIEESTITLNDCVHVTLDVATPAEGKVYSVQFDNDAVIKYTAKTGDTALVVAVALASQSVPKWQGNVVDGKVVFEHTDRRYGAVVVPNESFTVIQVGSPIRFDCEEYGAIEPLLNSVTYINTNYDGWFSVSNESETYVGRDYETASEVRQRYASAVFKNSVGMVESIKAALMELQDVTSVTIYENRTDETVDGLKPHSFQTIVFGGDEEAIARTILSVAPLGIDTNGDICVRVEDTEGASQNICFSRPHEVPIYVKVIIKEYNEEVLPGDAIDKIKNIVLAQFEKLSMGNDVIYQRLLGPIYSGVDGISYIECSVSKDGQTYKQENITIDRGELAVTKLADITVALEL
nr:MAG TPA: Baseplate wedge protein [Caudoviricetes sp.]